MSLALAALLALSPAQVRTTTAALSLEDALQSALAHNEVPAIAEARLERARAARQEAYAALFPNLGVAGTYRRRAFEIVREFGVIQRFNALSADATVRVPIFNAQAIPRIQEAEDAERAQALATEDMRRNLAFEVAESFYAAWTALWTLRAAERRLTLAQEAVGQAEARHQAGLTNLSALNRSQLELASARLSRTRAENAARLARLTLGFLMGGDDGRPLVEPQVEDRPPPVGEAALIAEAEGARLDLAALTARAEAARHAARVPWAGLIPSINAIGNLRGTNETGFVGEVFNWDVAISLEWLLFDGGARYARARGLDAAAREAELEAARLRRQIELEIRAALSELEAAGAAVVEAAEQRRVATANADEVRARFARGLASGLEQADAAVAEFEAATTLERARLEAALAHLRIRAALGGWPSAD